MTPTSVPGACKQDGFTLVEILVVLLVIGIATAVVVANISPDDKQTAQIEASRLADLLEQTAEDAQDTGNAIAWSVRGDAYIFWRKKEDGTWEEVANDDLYRRHVLGNGVKFGQIRADGVPLAPGERLVFNPSGVNRPFEVTLERNGALVRISSDAMNRMEVQ